MQRIGVVGAITSWNFPLAMITRKVSPALASGCTVVLPILCSCFEFFLYDSFTCIFNRVFSNHLCVLSDILTILIDCFVSFDGSCCIYCKKVSLELGGDAPSIIFDDADLDVAVKATVSDSHENSGQTCVCANRVLVQDGIYDKFAEAFSEAVQKLEVGDGFKEGTPRYAPFLDLMRLLCDSFVQDAVSNRAKIILGGKRHSLGMTFYEALLLSVIMSMQEIFGPVAPLIRFITEKEAVRIANDTIAGLAAYIFTNSTRNGRITFLKIMKQSSLGKEGSKYGLDEYLEVTQNTHHMNTL
ncbi:BnaA02g36110D [Brassica napus]|uniref:BnaA02g36110D protein n=1 Tax=Brassica napus TaxID=3708 RepID=A0A078J0V8_BRANA|nr:BnaA02g36110D [Brassica napus]